MKTFLSALFTLALGGAMILNITCLPATAQILFDDNFAKAAARKRNGRFCRASGR